MIPGLALAAVFFLAEVATVLAMGWLIKSNRLEFDDYAAYLIAALAPMPLWLSSVGLLVPNLLFTATIAAAALAFSCRAVYQGIVGLGRVREPATAAWPRKSRSAEASSSASCCSRVLMT